MVVTKLLLYRVWQK